VLDLNNMGTALGAAAWEFGAQRCGKAENGPGKTRYELVAHWLDPRF
jgi:hypothetical protein